MLKTCLVFLSLHLSLISTCSLHLEKKCNGCFRGFDGKTNSHSMSFIIVTLFSDGVRFHRDNNHHKTDDVTGDDVTADDVTADGVTADGITADGVAADGVTVDGVTFVSHQQQHNHHDLTGLISLASKMFLKQCQVTLSAHKGHIHEQQCNSHKLLIQLQNMIHTLFILCSRFICTSSTFLQLIYTLFTRCSK